MIFSLRRKRQTTVRGPAISRIATARRQEARGTGRGASVLAALLLYSGSAPGQPVSPQEQLPVQPRSRVQSAESRFELPLELPGQERLFRRESEAEVFERIRQQERQSGASGRVLFPEQTPVSTALYAPRAFPVSTMLVENCYVSHGRLHYEQRNFERHGWDLGVLQPPVSLGRFWWDTLILPYHMGTRVCQRYDTSAGKCLPGDPTPLYLYPPEFSMTGLLFQAGAVYTGSVLFSPR